MISTSPSRRAICAIAAFVLVLLFFFHSQPLDENFKPRLFGTQRATVTLENALSGDKRDLLDDIYNSTLGFEGILVVGLPSRSDRRDGMTLQASLTNLNIDFVDGVLGESIAEKAIPSSPDHGHLEGAVLGTWRGHMNAVREVVRRNLSSALIIEDDTDWDVRIKHELRDLALSTRTLTQPLVANPNTYADPSFPKPAPDSPGKPVEFDFHNLPDTVPPKYSPYGDDWDLLWLGQCAMRVPDGGVETVPKGRVIHHDDETVPEGRYMWSFTQPFELVEKYPQHTRLVHHAQEGSCALGYAISQRGAQRLLHEIALKDVSDAVDILLRFFCEGDKGRRSHTCLTVQPGIFQHHRTVGSIKASSDIGDHGDGWRDRAFTDMVRWSTRLNADAIMDGATEFWDQFPNMPPEEQKKGEQ